jgi:hypothetical protein
MRRSRQRRDQSASARGCGTAAAVNDAKPDILRALGFFVEAAGLALDQIGFDPARDCGEDF